MLLCFVSLTLFSSGGRAADISQLAWLGGCWKSDTAEPGSGEHWMPLAGGTLLGVSRTIKQGKTVEFEFMRIQASADGQLVFTATPSGQQVTTFPLVHLSQFEVIFENPHHDFPQRIIYQLESPTRIRARIEGTLTGTRKVIEFPMSKVGCESQASAAAK